MFLHNLCNEERDLFEELQELPDLEKVGNDEVASLLAGYCERLQKKIALSLIFVRSVGKAVIIGCFVDWPIPSRRPTTTRPQDSNPIGHMRTHPRSTCTSKYPSCLQQTVAHGRSSHHSQEPSPLVMPLIHRCIALPPVRKHTRTASSTHKAQNLQQ